MGRSTTAVLILASIGMAAAVGLRSRRPSPEVPELADLARAIGSSLPFEARLSGGFLPGQGDVRRATSAQAADLSPDARIAIARIEKRAAADPSAAVLAAAGVAALVAGDVDRATSTLEEVTAIGPSAAVWNDLSAAYLVKAQQTPARRVEYVVRAVDAAITSARIRDSVEAHVNRSLAMAALAPYLSPADDALRKWESEKESFRAHLAASDRQLVRDTVRSFPDAALEFFDRELFVDWARATRSGDGRRSAALVRQLQLLGDVLSEITGDPLQRQAATVISAGRVADAHAHLDYVDAIGRYEANRFDEANALFAAAAKDMRAAGDPYRLWADLQRAIIAFQRRDLDAADRSLAAIEPQARRGGYTVLLGRTLWVRGLLDTKVHRLTEALDAFRAAEACFERAQLHEPSVSLAGDIADGLRVLGEHQDSWQYIGKTLEGLGQVRKPLRRYLFLYTASLFASTQALLEAAVVFQDAAVAAAHAAGVGPTVEALTVRASLLARRGDQAAARRDVDEARRALTGLPDGAAKRYLQAQLDLVFVGVGDAADVSRQAGDLEQALAFFATAEPTLVPKLHLGLGRTYLAIGAIDRAEAAFDRGITELERQQGHVDDPVLRTSYFDESWDLYPAMIALQLDIRHAPDAAFNYAERARARSLLGTEQPTTLGELQQSLPEAHVVLYYAVQADRVLIWTVTRDGHDVRAQHINRGQLSSMIARYRAALVNRQSSADAAGEALFDLLLTPALSRVAAGASLVVIADGELQQVPFAALRDRRSGAYLVEQHRLIASPSATFFARRRSHARDLDARSIGAALLVGNPAVANAALHGAEQEVAAAAAVYPQHSVFVGADATKDRFVRSIETFDVVHFGGHAFANAQYPALSRLAFAGSGGSEEPLFAYEIARMRLPRTRLVVLAACSSGAGAVSRGEGVMSVARPFLAAGVPRVVVAQWDVEDRATARFFETFHRRFRESNDAAGAVRAAQLSFIHSGDVHLASPASWAAFITLGTSSH